MNYFVIKTTKIKILSVIILGMEVITNEFGNISTWQILSFGKESLSFQELVKLVPVIVSTIFQQIYSSALVKGKFYYCEV